MVRKAPSSQALYAWLLTVLLCINILRRRESSRESSWKNPRSCLFGLLFFSCHHRWPARTCCRPAQFASNWLPVCVEPAMSSGCNVGVSPQGHAVELAAMKVRFVRLTEELIWCSGKPETQSQSVLYVGESWRGRKCCFLVASPTTDNLPSVC